MTKIILFRQTQKPESLQQISEQAGKTVAAIAMLWGALYVVRENGGVPHGGFGPLVGDARRELRALLAMIDEGNEVEINKLIEIRAEDGGED